MLLGTAGLSAGAAVDDRFPALLGLPAWARELLRGFQSDLVERLDPVGHWLARGYRFALFPVWFFAIEAVVNGIAHPVLALVAQGYLPGLITSPVVGVLGVLL